MPIYPSDLDIPPFQLRRSSATTVSNYVAAAGEPVWAYDTNTLYIGDGTTVGAIPIAGDGAPGNVNTVTDQKLFTTSSVTFADVAITNTATISDLKLTGIANATATTILYYDAATDTVSYDVNTGGAAVNPFDQDLNTTDEVVFNGVTTTKVTSAGGFPLDSNGEALINVSNTQSGALVVSNYTSGILPTLNIRGYGQNRPGGGATTSGTPGILVESSRGTNSSPTAVGSGDTISNFSAGGFDGTEWSGGRNQYPFQMAVLASEAWAGDATTTTNAGTRLLLRVQPQGAQLNSTSRQLFLNQTWTAGSTATSSPPQLNMFWGSPDSSVSTLTPSGGVGSFGTGFGSTNVFGINTKQYIYGVPYQDTAPDNATLTGTNILSFVAGRRSGVTGRRNAIQSSDQLGFIEFRGQNSNNSTTSGVRGGSIYASALENFGSTTRGTKLVLTTVNSGTTSEVTRLSIDDQQINHYSANHRLYSADGASQFLQANSSGVKISNAYTLPTAAPTTDDQYMTSTAAGVATWTDRVNAKTIYETVKNVSGGTLTKGTPVYQVGVTGNTVTVAAARADDPTKIAVGILDVELDNDEEGRMLVLGEIKGVDTNSFATGDEVYLGATGGYTNVKPTGTNFVQFLGVVNRVDSSNGSGYITGTLQPDAVKYEASTPYIWTGTDWTVLGGDNPFDQNLNTTDSPTFANLDVTNTATVGNLVITGQTIALGSGSSANTQGTAVGYNATTQYGTAIGGNATASGGGSAAIGQNSDATGDYSNALGAYANASGNYSTAVGGAVANNTYNVAIGQAAGYDGSSTINSSSTIIINATGENLVAADHSGFYVAPLTNATSANVVYYNTTSKEITYGAATNPFDQQLDTTSTVAFADLTVNGKTLQQIAMGRAIAAAIVFG